MWRSTSASHVGGMVPAVSFRAGTNGAERQRARASPFRILAPRNNAASTDVATPQQRVPLQAKDDLESLLYGSSGDDDDDNHDGRHDGSSGHTADGGARSSRAAASLGPTIQQYQQRQASRRTPSTSTAGTRSTQRHDDGGSPQLQQLRQQRHTRQAQKQPQEEQQALRRSPTLRASPHRTAGSTRHHPPVPKLSGLPKLGFDASPLMKLALGAPVHHRYVQPVVQVVDCSSIVT